MAITRRECEIKILDLLSEVRKVLKEYAPEYDSCSLSMSDDDEGRYDSVFMFTKGYEDEIFSNENNEKRIPSDTDYVLRLSRCQIKEG